MNEIIKNILSTISNTSWLEWLSVIFGVVQVLLSKNNKISNYFFGIIGIISGMFVLYTAKLYAEIALQLYYLSMSVYGWWYWSRGTTKKSELITKCTRKDWKIVLAIVLIGFFFFMVLLKQITDSDVPVWDAWVTSTAWAGMWLLAKRKIENWVLLNISNIFAIPLLIHKDLYLFAGLTIFLSIVAVFGYFNWKKIMINQPANVE